MWIVTPPEEIVSGLILSGIFVQAHCNCAKVEIILLLPGDKKLSLRRGNINIINLLLEVTVTQIEFINTQS